MSAEGSSSGLRPPMVGDTLDRRFFLKRQLGRGNFGTVFLAEQRVFDIALRTVALKLLHGELITEKNASELLKDAILLMSLQGESSHSVAARHLVTVIDAGFLHDRPGQAFVSMEYVTGYQTASGGTIATLEGLIRAFRPVPVELAVKWMLQVVRPIAWMHGLDHPVLHCDLKPDNILVSGQDTLKIADFGLAQVVFGIVGSSHAVGALICQAPETLGGLRPTPASDVYALGLIFYQVLAGHNPLNDVGREALAAERDDEYRRAQIACRAEGLPPLAESRHADPALKDHPVLVGIVERCLRFSALDRYENASLLLSDLERYAKGEGIDVVLPTAVAEPQALVKTEGRLLAEAREFLRQEKFAPARDRCEQARQRFPASGKPYRWLAEIVMSESGEENIGPGAEQALQICAAGMKVDADEPELYEVMATARDRLNQLEVGKRMREKAAQLRARRQASRR